MHDQSMDIAFIICQLQQALQLYLEELPVVESFVRLQAIYQQSFVELFAADHRQPELFEKFEGVAH